MSNGEDITLNRDQALFVLAALEEAISLAEATDAGAVQILVEDAFSVIRDAIFPDMPEG